MIEEDHNENIQMQPGQIHGQERLDIRKYTPNRDQERPVDIRVPRIWSCFPLSERFWYSFCCKSKCCTDFKSNVFYSADCLARNCIRDPKIEISDKILQLSILKTGTLQIESIVFHPFVRISFVNLKTGRYLQKINFDIPSVLRTERNFIIQHNKVQNRLDFQSSALDIIPPVATSPYDLREKGESYAEWNEDFFFNEDAVSLLDTNVIIFFELLDFNLNYRLNAVEECIYPMAWGYLKPVGFSQTYMGKHKIQLYKHKFTRSAEINDLKKKSFDYLRTPDILYELDWIKKEKYQTFLQIKLDLTTRPTAEDMKKAYFYNKFIYSVFCPEGDDIDYDLIKFQKKLIKPDVEVTTDAKKEQMLRWRRTPGEDCIVPNKLVYKLSTAKLGCLTHEFSPNGKYIAAACTEITSETTIKVFNVEDGALKYHFKGHHQIIHHFTWSFDNLLLISASADHIVSIWRIPKEESNDLSNLEYLDNSFKFKFTSIAHPAYVYSTDIYPDKSKELMILATACFDGMVRFFAINLSYDMATASYTWIKTTNLFEIQVSQDMNDVEYFKNLSENIKNTPMSGKDKVKIGLLKKTALDHRHPNSIVFDISGQLYIGDSLGYIHIWELRLSRGNPSLNKLRIVTHKELEYDTINKIAISPKDPKKLIIHSRDNCIRVVDISTEKPRVIIRFFGLKCNKTNIKSTPSPDGSYVLSGSEEGIPHIWSMESGIAIGTKKFECGVIDSINDVSWNGCYNMTALSAFGQEYPLLIHVFEKKSVSIAKSDLKIKGEKPQTRPLDPLMSNNETLIEEEPDVGGEDQRLNPIQGNMSQFSIGYKTMVEKNVNP